jgi:TonB family protein
MTVTDKFLSTSTMRYLMHPPRDNRGRPKADRNHVLLHATSFRPLKFAALLLFAGNFAIGQEAASPAPSTPTDSPVSLPSVYSIGPEVTAPELLPIEHKIVTDEKCKKNVDGSGTVQLIVDATGAPRDIAFIHQLPTDFDRLSVQIALHDHFKAGTHVGQPVPVRLSLEVGLQGCVTKVKDASGNKADVVQLRSQPVQKLVASTLPANKVIPAWMGINSFGGRPNVYHIGGGIAPPTPLATPPAEYDSAARAARVQGSDVVSLIVDAEGMPQEVHIVRSLDPGLDQKAVEAVKKYRFKPARKPDGTPVAVSMSIVVTFRLY